MKRKREGNTLTNAASANSPRTNALLVSANRSRRRIAALAAHDVGNVIQRYRPPRFTSFTDRTNLPKWTIERAAGARW